MGNVYSGIKNYFYSSEEILTPDQIISHVDQIKQNTISDQIKTLQDQIDRNRNNIVTKDELKDYFEKISNKIDSNSDGVITRDELETYVKEQIKSSQAETERWKQAYEQLHKKYEEILDHPINNIDSIDITDRPINTISSKALKEYIRNEILNTDANIGVIPDALEKRVYLVVYKTIMKSLEGLVNTTSIDLLNHRISFAIHPVPLQERD